MTPARGPFRLESGVVRRRAVAFEVDGSRLSCFDGETLLTALMAAGVEAYRQDRRGGSRAPYCNMGVCQECVVLLERGDGLRIPVRACSVAVVDGMRVFMRGAVDVR